MSRCPPRRPNTHSNSSSKNTQQSTHSWGGLAVHCRLDVITHCQGEATHSSDAGRLSSDNWEMRCNPQACSYNWSARGPPVIQALYSFTKSVRTFYLQYHSTYFDWTWLNFPSYWFLFRLMTLYQLQRLYRVKLHRKIIMNDEGKVVFCSLFHDTFLVTRLHSVDERVTS
jgi:hypothetical protein